MDRGYLLEDFDCDAAAAGFEIEHRFATWGVQPRIPTPSPR